MTDAQKPAQRPLSDHDWTIHSLNIQGTFFEHWCQYIINKNPRWHVRDTQYPVAFSPMAGPLHKSSGHESTLDLRAELSFGDGRVLNLLIECKKNNPEFVDWMFFSEVKPSTISAPFIAPAVSCHAISTNTDKPILTPILKDLYLDIPVADEGRETRGDYQSFNNPNKKTKTANDSISNAAHQVALATQAIFLEEASSNLPALPIKGAVRRRIEKQVFMPAIITTARLHLCEFDPSDISPSEGVIPYDKVKITEQPYLIFKYPLPVHLQLDRSQILFLSSQNKAEFLVRMHIFVINSLHFSEFLNFLIGRFPDLFDDMNVAS